MPKIDIDEIIRLVQADNNDGVCLACGEIQMGGVEPDAENYECESCGARKVCGVEQYLFLHGDEA